MDHDLETFFDLSLDLLCVAGVDGFLKRVNPSFSETLGWSERELLERPFLEFVHPDDRTATEAELQRLAGGDSVISFTNRYRCRDGSHRWLEWKSRPGPGGNLVYAAARDTTELVRSARRAERLAQAMGQSRSGLAVLDTGGRVTYANPRLLRLVGLAEEDVAGAEIVSLLSDVDLPQGLREDLTDPNVALTWQDEVRSRAAAGGELWLEVAVTPVRDDSGSLSGHLLRVDDVTERRKSHEALMRSGRAKDDFLATMSHELRTPLNAVITIAESLEEGVYGELAESQLDALVTVSESGRHLLTLINDILDTAKIEAGKLSLQERSVVVRDVCEASLRLVREQAQRKGHDLEVGYGPEVETLEADEKRLKQILVNLLTNAVKFTPPGGSVRLRVEGDPERGTVTFSVTDTGIGIEADDLERMFQPFVQSESDLSRSEEGTGLGLTLALRLTEMHGGSLTVESPGRDRGSRFTVTLPWRQAEIDVGADDPVEAHDFGRALLVEDSAVTSDQLTRYLEELGIEAELNRFGEDVVEHAARFEPDVILLDLLLPRASGWTILSELKADRRTRGIPVLVVSVMDEPERGWTAGADAFLLKPVSRSDLARALRSVHCGASRSELERPPGGGAERLVLLAEDNEANVKALLPFLRSRGFDVEVARDGREAVDRCATLRPDLVLMDVQMPGMDGLEATRRIRSRDEDEERHTPIVTLTALAMPGDRERCLAAGADAYLPKPVSVKGLSKVMDELVGGGSRP